MGGRFAAGSQLPAPWCVLMACHAANAAGRFRAELASLQVPGKKGPEEFAVDEHPRPQATLDGLAKLPPVFQKDGVVTAGSASGISDGAAALIVAGDAACSRHGYTPLARLVAWHVAGVDPSVMGIGPVPAVRGLLAKTGLRLGDVQLFEVNEAFAAQYLSVEKELGLPRAHTNTNGGAIALGHPLAASGARITTHLVHELHRTGGRYAIGSACIGGGQGIAVLLESAAPGRA